MAHFVTFNHQPINALWDTIFGEGNTPDEDAYNGLQDVPLQLFAADDEVSKHPSMEPQQD
jgi:hypothetical protein